MPMNFASLIRARWLPLLLASLLALAAAEAGAQMSAKPGKYGKALVMDKTLALADIEKLSAFLQDLAARNKGVANSVMDGDTFDWVGDPMTGQPSKSPYTMVVSVTGTARAAGDVVTTWKSGWKMPDGGTRVSLMSGLAAFEVKAGQRVTLTAPASPVHFDRDKDVMPALSLVDARNVDIDGVEVQVWSGMTSPSLFQWLTASPMLWLGVVMLGVVFVFRRI
jgi:hypothetical protein